MYSFCLSLVFSNSNAILHQINVKNLPSCIRHRDSNSRPVGHEYPPITSKQVLTFFILSTFGQNFGNRTSVMSMKSRLFKPLDHHHKGYKYLILLFADLKATNTEATALKRPHSAASSTRPPWTSAWSLGASSKRPFSTLRRTTATMLNRSSSIPCKIFIILN